MRSRTKYDSWPSRDDLGSSDSKELAYGTMIEKVTKAIEAGAEIRIYWLRMQFVALVPSS
jgi:hypothetical protein